MLEVTALNHARMQELEAKKESCDGCRCGSESESPRAEAKTKGGTGSYKGGASASESRLRQRRKETCRRRASRGDASETSSSSRYRVSVGFLRAFDLPQRGSCTGLTARLYNSCLRGLSDWL